MEAYRYRVLDANRVAGLILVNPFGLRRDEGLLTRPGESGDCFR